MVEPMSEVFAGKQVLVVGVGRSGYDAALALKQRGAHVVACDTRCPPLAKDLQRQGVEVLCDWQGGVPSHHFDIVVTSPGVRADSVILREAASQGIAVWSEVELAYHLTDRPIVAVTGTNGKSTTAALIAHLLRGAGVAAILCGNIAAEGMERTLTDAAIHAQGDEVLVAEVSSFQLEWVHAFRPRVAVWTTFSPDHLDRHGTIEEYGRTKARLFKRMLPEDLALLPADDAQIQAFVDTQAKKVYFSHQNINTNVESCIYHEAEEVYFKQDGKRQRLCSVRGFQLLGIHNLRNLVAAIGACLPWSPRSPQLEEAIRRVRPLPHRMEWVADVAGVRYVNNSMCTNLEAARESLRAVPAPVVLIMGGVDKSESDFGELADLLREKGRYVLLIGVDAQRIEGQLRAAGWQEVSQCEGLLEAVYLARQIAEPGDWVMLSPGCASFDMFANFQERGEAFRRAVRQLEAGG